MKQPNTFRYFNFLSPLKGVLGLIIVLGGEASLQATDGTWSTAGSGNWNTAANWSGGIIANGTDAIADFSQVNIGANSTITQDLTGLTVGTLKMGDTTPSHSWTMTSGSIALATSSGAPTINVVNPTQAFSLISTVTGTQGLTKIGSGTFYLSGTANNTFTGTVTVTTGTLVLNKSAGINATASTSIAVGLGSALTWNASEQLVNTANISVSGGTLNLSGKSETVGTLTTTGNSIINLSTTSSIIFSDSSINLWSGTLKLYNYDNTDVIGFSTSTGLTASQLSMINFYSDAGTTLLGSGGKLDSNGFLTLAIPEPQSMALLLIALMIVAIPFRKRFSKTSTLALQS
ncbi:MAG: hypothetical protein V4507_06155 [Verrucomicrobiota bacterium]